jgi:hypothetical protein
MVHHIDKINNAKQLRYQGYSFGEIANKLEIAKSTAHLWVNKVELNKKALQKLNKKRVLARLKALEAMRMIRELKKYLIKKQAVESINNINLNKDIKKLLCSFLYWGEGSKNTNSLIFTNSDPLMIKLYLKLLRESFKLDERKFRGLVHIHEYHNEVMIKNYWAKITNIPLNQFSKSYLKPHTSKNIRDGYKGTISISYYDYKIALELSFVYNWFAEKLTI